MGKRRVRVLKKPGGRVAGRHLEEHSSAFKQELGSAMASMTTGARHWSSANEHLLEIKNRKLYKLKAATLDEYVEKFLGISPRRMRQILAHTKLLGEMTEESVAEKRNHGAAFLERHTRAISALPEKKHRKEAADKAVERAEAEGSTVVEQRHVNAAVAEVMDDADREARPEVTALERAIEQERPLVECQKSLKAVGDMAIALCEEPIGAYINTQALKSSMNDIWRILKFARPHGLCPYCGGDRCSTCKSTGWMPADVWGAAPADMREAVAHR